MAIVVDTAEGDYLISDILEATVHQSLTAPAFSTEWIVKGAAPVASRRNTRCWWTYRFPSWAGCTTSATTRTSATTGPVKA